MILLERPTQKVPIGSVVSGINFAKEKYDTPEAVTSFFKTVIPLVELNEFSRKKLNIMISS